MKKQSKAHLAGRETGAAKDLGGALPRQVDHVEGDVEQLVRFLCVYSRGDG